MRYASTIVIDIDHNNLVVYVVYSEIRRDSPLLNLKTLKHSSDLQQYCTVVLCILKVITPISLFI